MKKALFLLCSLLFAFGLFAQDESEQVLVFRNTGEVNLFYADRLDSIAFSRFDADSIEHEDVVSQVFYDADTVLVVPIAEIDSVAFGSRNAVSMKKDVAVLTAEETQWIVRYDGSCIYYRGDTPEDILPEPGDKLFYGEMDSLFPVGLVAKVNSVERLENEYAVRVGDIELSEVFDRLFYAGGITESQLPTGSPVKRAPLFNNTLNIGLNVGENLGISGSDRFSVEGTVVANPLRGYYYFDADIKNGLDITMSAKLQATDRIEEELEIAELPLGVYALVFTPTINFSVFADISAELSANMSFRRSAQVHVNYVKRRGDDPLVSVKSVDGEDGATASQVDVTCKGNVYLGVKPVIDFNILRETAGVRCKMSLGPSFSSEFGLGLLQQAAEKYSPEIYGKAQLDACMKLRLELSAYMRNLVWGEESEQLILRNDFDFLKRTLNLFPHFLRTKATGGMASSGVERIWEITTSTRTDTDLLSELQAGFELTDSEGEVLDSIFVDTLQAGCDVMQGVAADFERELVPKEELESLRVRPVFHYAGQTIKADYASIQGDMQIQPLLFGMSNGVASVVSSYPYIGSVVKDSTLYQAGAYIPVAVIDTVFNKPHGIVAGLYLGDDLCDELVGTWQGVENAVEVTYVFNADDTGSYTHEGATDTFSFSVNEPQSGRITLKMDNGERVKMLSVESIQNGVMRYAIIGVSGLNELHKSDSWVDL